MTMTASGPLKFRYKFHSSHLLWLTLFLVSTIVQLAGWADSWRYQRDLVAQGDFWLLFSGHIVHLTWTHWLLNMAGLAIVAFFFSSHASVRQWLLVIFMSVLVISIGLYGWITDVRSYVGLSGVLHGLFLYGALREIRFYPASGYVLVTILLAKLCWEFFNGALPGSEEMAGGRVLTEAHLLGAIGGMLVWFGEWIKGRIVTRSAGDGRA